MKARLDESMDFHLQDALVAQNVCLACSTFLLAFIYCVCHAIPIIFAKRQRKWSNNKLSIVKKDDSHSHVQNYNNVQHILCVMSLFISLKEQQREKQEL